jgi:hypothetical protein
MSPRSRPLGTVRHWFSAVFAVLAIAAQLVVAVAPLAEGRDGRMASHVEAGGAASHYTHSEASCAACQARSIHGTTSRPAAPVIRAAIVATAVADFTHRVVSGDFHLQANPRAPPSVI